METNLIEIIRKAREYAESDWDHAKNQTDVNNACLCFKLLNYIYKAMI